jgi:5-formyltetrahydrofolate cyclo-ligase
MDTSPLPDKAVLRAEARVRRAALSARERLKLSEKAARHMLDSRLWHEARSVGLYVAARGEIDTTLLLEDAWRNGKETLLPVCSQTGQGVMRLAPASGFDALSPGPFGIPEPSCGEENVTEAPEHCPDMIILPGLAFDHAGRRLGQGGGYYDRLLSRFPYAKTHRVGLAYSFQIVDSLPHEAWDVPVHAVCTDEGILWMEKKYAARFLP